MHPQNRGEYNRGERIRLKTLVKGQIDDTVNQRLRRPGLVEDDSKKVENRRQHDSAKWRGEKIEPGDDGAAKQKCEAKCQQEPRAKEKFALADR
jgi:hypothetical protein